MHNIKDKQTSKQKPQHFEKLVDLFHVTLKGQTKSSALKLQGENFNSI